MATWLALVQLIFSEISIVRIKIQNESDSYSSTVKNIHFLVRAWTTLYQGLISVNSYDFQSTIKILVLFSKVDNNVEQ